MSAERNSPERRRRATLREVAAEAGVSLGTASHALNESPRIRSETRARVLDVAQRLNYVANRHVTRLVHGFSECIGVAFAGQAPTLTSGVLHFMMLRGITELLEEHGYSMRLVRLDHPEALSVPRPGRRRSLSAQDVDGLIVMNWIDPALMDRLRGIGVPLVALDCSGAFLDELSVDADERGGVAAGVGYLIGLGHTHIAFLNRSLERPFGRETLAGFLRAFELAGLAVEPWLLRTCGYSVTEGYRVTTELLSDTAPLTAVFSVGDEISIGVLRAVHERGLRIPQDISIVSMADIPLAAETHPPLTTVRIDGEALGRQAAELLLAAITGGEPPSRIVLPTSLVVRESAGSPRSLHGS